MRILNLFAGIGGNRAAWGNEHEVVSVENDPQIAAMYRKRFPQDEIIVADAFQYFMDHFHKFDFVWASPPCQTHSAFVRFNVARRYNGNDMKIKLPDSRLWELIQFLQRHYRGEFVVENVVTDYDPWIKPTAQIGRHYYWTSKPIPSIKRKDSEVTFEIDNIDAHLKYLSELHDVDLSIFDNTKGLVKKTILRNCVLKEDAKMITEYLIGEPEEMNACEI